MLLDYKIFSWYFTLNGLEAELNEYVAEIFNVYRGDIPILFYRVEWSYQKLIKFAAISH